MNGKNTFSIFILSIAAVLVVGCTEEIPDTSAVNKSDKRSARINPIDAFSSTPGYIIRDAAGNRVTSALPPPVTIKANHLQPSHVRGARIYDDFMIELANDPGATMPAGDNPLLAIAANPGAVPGGMGSWLCSSCHGFDYEGGVLNYNGGGSDNLLELRDVRGRDESAIYEMLMTGFDAFNGTAVINVHNYSAILTPQAITDVSDFVVNEIYDTHLYVRAPTGGSLGDMGEGMAIWASAAAPGEIPPLIAVDGGNYNCDTCHGALGPSMPITDLAALSWANPFRWMHRVLFGSPRDLVAFPGFTRDPTVMPGFYEIVLTDGLHFGGPEQGAAVMSHVQANTL